MSMTQRTCNIIMCCKPGNCLLEGAAGEPLHDIALYMSKECGCPIETYDTHIMENIMEEAFFDFIDCAVNPSHELRQLFHCHVPENAGFLERVCIMFSLTQVLSDCTYINGFDSELIKQSEIDLGGHS